MKNQVSLCMIVKNEEEYLSNCLNSIKDVVDEIIIVDTGSTDKTVEIAKNFGAKIYYFEWNDNFSAARNESLKHATKDWILILDGDDELCEKDANNLKLFLNNELDERAVYYFETLSYFGTSINEGNIAININPRLFKNNRGIYYKGEIHNQLVCQEDQYNVICESVKIRHYGYLNSTIASKDKRKRNISILKEQIKNGTNNIGFAYFNLGNEYNALDEVEKALECYYKSYEEFDAQRGYSYVLVLRIIIANYNLRRYEEALNFVKIGVEQYPKCTDIYYHEAMIWDALNRPTLQVKALKKCIELGEAPPELKFIYGTGSFRAYYCLANVYLNYRDYDAAYKYYLEAINSKYDFIDPFYNIMYLLKEQNVDINEFKSIIEGFFEKNIESYYELIASLFYEIGYYDTALEYIEKSEKVGQVTEGMMIIKIKSLIRCGKFEECIKLNYFNEETNNYVSHSIYKILCAFILKNYNYAIKLIGSLSVKNLSEYNKKKINICIELKKLLNKESSNEIECSEDDGDYIKIVLEILEILLINQKFDEFGKAVYLLNLINNKYSLLNLGKLYFKYGYIEFAKKEIIRSIKDLDVYDNEGLEILKI